MTLLNIVTLTTIANFSLKYFSWRYSDSSPLKGLPYCPSTSNTGSSDKIISSLTWEFLSCAFVTLWRSDRYIWKRSVTCSMIDSIATCDILCFSLIFNIHLAAALFRASEFETTLLWSSIERKKTRPVKIWLLCDKNCTNIYIIGSTIILVLF